VRWAQSDLFDGWTGEQFLIGFVCFSILVVMSGRLIVGRMDRTLELPPMRIPSSPDPYEVAYLRGGVDEVFRVLVFGLIERGYLVVMEADRTLVQRALNTPEVTDLVNIEACLFGSFSTPRRMDELLLETRPLITEHCESYRVSAASQLLLSTQEARQQAGRLRIFGIALLSSLALYRVGTAMLEGRGNIGFLLLLTACSILAAVGATRVPRLTRRGQEYLERLQNAFGFTHGGTYAVAADPLNILATALFGFAWLAEADLNTYRELFPQADWSFSGGADGGGDGCGGCGGCGD
jgi:uncharacterized protein (TIGR04222 family)